MPSILCTPADVAFVVPPGRSDRVVISRLPSGPIYVLEGPAAQVWLAVRDHGEACDREAAVAAVLDLYREPPPEARLLIQEAVAELVDDQLLAERAPV